MTAFEKKVYDSLIENSTLFLNETLGRIMKQVGDAKVEDEKQLLTISCAELQISLELAICATLIKTYGISYVLSSKQKNLSESDIIDHYFNKTLKVKDFEQQKRLLRANGRTSLTREDFKTIDRFQIYRNKIVHFSCVFNESELNHLRDDILYYTVNVVLRLLCETATGESPAEFLQSKIGYVLYDRLRHYEPYVKAIESYAQREVSPLWDCISCSHRTFSPELDFCFICGYETPSRFRRVDCGSCGTKGSVIYDNWNIHLEGNHHSMRGRCLECGEDTYVFECPVCGEAHDISMEWNRAYCNRERCINMPQDCNQECNRTK